MTSRRPLLFLVLALLALEVTACGASHISEYEPKRRDYAMPVELPEAESARQEGSLWSESSQANILFADQRAMRLGDIVTVRVEEFANASRDANTELRREAQLNAEIQQFLGAMAALQAANPAFAQGLGIDGGSTKTFNGQGSTART
ncbi:MAG: flagellar basal body L-ring protein FlgH, partial [Myxococcota bacterium]